MNDEVAMDRLVANYDFYSQRFESHGGHDEVIDSRIDGEIIPSLVVSSSAAVGFFDEDVGKRNRITVLVPNRSADALRAARACHNGNNHTDQ